MDGFEVPVLQDTIRCTRRTVLGAARFQSPARKEEILSRTGVTLNPCLPENVIQAFVGQKNRIALNAIFQSVSSFFAARASHFENIGEISANRQLERNTYRRTTIIDDLKLFVADVAPKKFRAQNVDGAALDDQVVTVGDIDIRKICSEDEIVGLDRGTQQQRPGVPQCTDRVRTKTGFPGRKSPARPSPEVQYRRNGRTRQTCCRISERGARSSEGDDLVAM